MVDHGETTVAEVIHEALERGNLDRLSWPRPVSEQRLVEVPDTLDSIEVEAGSAADFDEILERVVHHG